MAEIDYFDRELGACGDAISWPFDVEKVRALRERNEYLEHRLFPGQGENYENEVERLRYVLDEYRRILDERQEAYAELYGTEQWLRYEWGKRGETIDRVTALCDQAERNYGGSAGMANVEAWVHLGSLRRALADPLPECNGICLYGSDLGVPSDGVAYAHPDCELHGHLATNNVDGSPR